MKTKEELNALKEEVENVNRKLHELSEEELELVNGGFENLIKTIVGLATQKIINNDQQLADRYFYTHLTVRQRKGHRPFTWSVPFALLASNKSILTKKEDD